jgi:hypothetical protein
MRFGRTMRAALVAGLSMLAVPGQAAAVQGGERDVNNRFANVAILRFIDTEGTYPTDRWRCTGTLVAPTVIITAAHCTEAPVDTVYYSFNRQGPLGEPDAKPGIPAALRNDAGWTLGGTNTDGSQNIFTDPDWGGDLQIQSLDDIGIIVLDRPVTGIEPADIAPIGYLDGTRRGTLFTVAGYGVRFEKPASGPQKPAQIADRERRFTTSPLSNLTRDTIMLATNPKDKRGGGGTCFGDSGGPVFLDGYLVGVTSWGTSQFCTAGQAGYQRLDTEDAFEFYGPFLAG